MNVSYDGIHQIRFRWFSFLSAAIDNTVRFHRIGKASRKIFAYAVFAAEKERVTLRAPRSLFLQVSWVKNLYAASRLGF